MIFSTLAILVAIVGTSQSFPTPEARIVNGTDAADGEIPYIISLRGASGSHSCGGSIIGNDWILTAAHCVEGKSALSVNVQYGTTKISASGSNIAVVEKIIVHEKYNTYTIENDIALLKLAKSLVYNQFVQPVPLPQQDTEYIDRTPARLAGWGLNSSSGVIQTHLQTADLFTFDNDDCSQRHYGTIFPTNICAGVPEGGKGQCNGDSGGPLTINVDNKLAQVGIVSWSVKPCTVAPYPGVYTKVSKFIDWISKNSGLNFS